MTSIVRAAFDDAETLSALHGDCFDDRWSGTFITRLMESPNAIALIARGGGVPSGFILARVAADEAEILTVAVVSQARRQGLGRALVCQAAAHAVEMGAKTMFLEVETSNGAARALYEGLGFREAGQRRGYYREPGAPARDALTLRAELPFRKAAEIGLNWQD